MTYKPLMIIATLLMLFPTQAFSQDWVRRLAYVDRPDKLVERVMEDEPITYTRDVAPILQQNCQICHRPGSVAPMSFIEFRDVRRYARRIKDQVARRLMPPYHLDTGVGIQEVKNDWR